MYMLGHLLAVQGVCPWCGGRMGWASGSAMMLFMMLLWLVVLAVLVRLAWSRRGHLGPRAPRDRAEELVHERYVRGEIDETTHQRMLEELRQ